MTARILVVEDESDLELLIQQKFRHQIKAGEFKFDFALNGLEALKKLEEGNDYHVMLTDINMPEMDGLTLLGKIREMNLPMKAVVISAYGDMGNIRSAMNRGAFDFITKPIDLKDLEVTITRTLSETELIRKGLVATENLGKALVEKEVAIIEKEKAEEAKRFEQQFLANMSHEIRTPMNAVIGMTNLVLKTNLDERQLKYIEGIRISSENLLGIINDILDLSKIEAGKIEFEKIPFTVKSVLENVYTVLHFKAEEKSIALNIHDEENLPSLLGDPARINQVLINIVGNAIKFTAQGKVDVRCRALSQDENNATIEFSVTDTGIGIAADKIEKIFESFTQASPDTNRKFGGTGLGLTISKQLVEMMGGKLIASSEHGKGTTFTFTITLPVDRNGQQSAAGSQQSNAGDLDTIRKAKILLVEDNEFNRIVAVDTLTEFLGGIHIEIAGDGKEAIEKLQQSVYDIVLMDIQMPGMDGYDATKFIRTSTNAPLNKIPILAMTANATREEIEKCKECGMNGHVPKPFVPDMLFRKMSELLQAATKS
jgi:hypothetical protein